MQKRLMIAGLVTLGAATNSKPSGHSFESIVGGILGLAVVFGLVYLIAWGCGVGRG